jgi:prepilin-type N-terminal cleavage/methylation domain-containing protein
MRGFTLLELIVVAGITAIMAAVSLPVIISTMNTRKMETSASRIERVVNAGRDASRDSLRCTTVHTKLPPSANGTRGLAVYLHNSSNCDEWIDWEYPESQATVVGMVRVHPTLVSSVEILQPALDCVGTPPPVGCYYPVDRRGGVFRFDESGRVQMNAYLKMRPPYRIRLTMVDGTAEHYVVQPETGTLRRDNGL